MEKLLRRIAKRRGSPAVAASAAGRPEQPRPEEPKAKLTALYSYSALYSDDLSFEKGWREYYDENQITT